MDNLEKLVADAILERASETITIGGREYEIAPATPATLILVSELVAEMPAVNIKADNILLEVLATAKDVAVIGKITATLILGAKRLKKRRKLWVRNGWRWRRVNELDYVAERILDEVTNETLVKVISKRLGLMQISSFFEVTTFLSEANQLKRTREVETRCGAR